MSVEEQRIEMGELVKGYPQITEKLLWDISNTKYVVRDHLKTAKERSGLFNRLFDSLSGATAERDRQVKEHLQNQINQSFEMIMNHEKALTKLNLGQVLLCEKIEEITDHLNHVFNDLLKFNISITEIEEKIRTINQRLDKIELHIHGDNHIEFVLSKLALKKYPEASFLEMFFLALDELYWGPFGAYCHQYPDERQMKLETLSNKLMSVSDTLLRPLRKSGRTIAMSQLKMNTQSPLYHDMLLWLGDWVTPAETPYSNYILSSNKNAPNVPLIFNNKVPVYLLEECFNRDI